jgi:putative acetyltransferase
VDTFEIRTADLLDEDVSSLVRLHMEFGRASSPPEDAHALEVDELLDPSIMLFAAHTGDEILAVGALKEIDGDHAEVKTMYTVEWARGRGVGRAMLEHLLAKARHRGYRRVSLETGSMDVFAPARSLYRGAGFAPCNPFGEYQPSPNSVYMTLWLDEAV